MLVLFGKFNKSFPLLCPRDSCDTTFTVHRPIGFYGNKHFWICKCFAVLPNQLVVKQLLAFIVMLWRGVPHYLAVLFQCVQAAQKVFLHSVWRDKCLFFFLKTQLYSLQALINSELSNCQWWKQRLYPWTFDLTIPVIFLRLLRFNYSSQITLTSFNKSQIHMLLGWRASLHCWRNVFALDGMWSSCWETLVQPLSSSREMVQPPIHNDLSMFWAFIAQDPTLLYAWP